MPGMLPRMIHLSAKSSRDLGRIRKAAEREGAYRVATRIHAVLLNLRRQTTVAPL